ncbi:MAG: DUF1517 domain-containing protein [Myxococcota bacterium]
MTETTSPDDLIAAGIFGACCFLISLVGFIGVLVWMLRSRGQAVAPQQQGAPPPVPPQQPAMDFHLSVIALAFDSYFRGQVEAAVTAAASTLDPVSARVELIQRAARALLGVQAQWRHFGYGEKDLADLTGAQQSYTNAVADFRARSARPDDGGAMTVLTIILCTRGRRLGVDRLDTRQQVVELLSDRLRVDTGSLLGAEVLWAPPAGGLTELAVRERFPEMHALSV